MRFRKICGEYLFIGNIFRCLPLCIKYKRIDPTKISCSVIECRTIKSLAKYQNYKMYIEKFGRFELTVIEQLK